ncbi:hypothetical protein FKV68_12465 [Sinorhizobium mexicanum]|uniref:Uncharacterized protein n=1 Tax=Sinorhizobium mexicanum TaxID=375549 RepID=A0A859QP51_9HYPH|nr:hypothetical protein FKV68_12465 [Sinorhizobium mexicanum]
MAASIFISLIPKRFDSFARRTGRLQRRASYQTRKGRCGTLNCCMSLSLSRGRFKETCSRSPRTGIGQLSVGRRPTVAAGRPLRSGLAYRFSVSCLRIAASPASDTSTHFLSGAASAT